MCETGGAGGASAWGRSSFSVTFPRWSVFATPQQGTSGDVVAQLLVLPRRTTVESSSKFTVTFQLVASSGCATFGTAVLNVMETCCVKLPCGNGSAFEGGRFFCATKMVEMATLLGGSLAPTA